MRKLLGFVALLLVLAIGIALGAGPLGDEIESRTSDRHAQKGGASAPGSDEAGGSDPVDAALIGALAPAALDAKLAGQTVALIALPGAGTAAVKAISADVVAAGGAIASSTTLTEGLTAVSAKQLVDSLGGQLAAQLATQLPEVADPALTTYPRMGALLGAALTTKAASGPPGPAAATIRASLQAGGLVAEAPTGNLGTLTLLVTGANLDDAVLTGLVTGLATQTHGLVVAGSTNDGDIAAVRDEALPVGTFDGDETAAGAVATVLLLARQITAPGGAFGASGSDGTVPVG